MRRSAGPWTETVHPLLRHRHAAGFDGEIPWIASHRRELAAPDASGA
ncbi:MAG: hypothetical protein WBA63_06980 [Thermomicrobiales bacterium]